MTFDPHLVGQVPCLGHWSPLGAVGLLLLKDVVCDGASSIEWFPPAQHHGVIGDVGDSWSVRCIRDI